MVIHTLEKIKTEATKRYQNSVSHNHSLVHIENVVNNAKKLSQFYQLDNYLMEAICYLHDLTYTQYKSSLKTYLFEGKYIYKILRDFLGSFDIDELEQKIILNSCKKHPHSFPFRKLNRKSDIYTQILQDADTLDLFSEHRFTRFAKKLPFNLRPPKKLLYILRNKVLKHFLNVPKHIYA